MRFGGKLMQKQVDKSHYEFGRYVTKQRWASMWHQLDEVMKLRPERVLEVGPGPGVFKAMAGLFGVHVETLESIRSSSPIMSLRFSICRSRTVASMWSAPSRC